MGNISDLRKSCTSGIAESLADPKDSYFVHRQEKFKFNQDNHLRLNHFRSSLLKSQCFFVLNTLLQQYYKLFKQYGKVVVSDQLCHVTKLGQVKVDFQIDGPQTPLNLYNHVVNIFVTMFSQILETVTALALDQTWLESKQCSYFQQKITKIIYRYHSFDEKMYQELLKQISHYMEHNNIRCNLIPAIIRKKENNRSTVDTGPIFYGYENQLHTKTPFLGYSRSQSQSEVINSSEKPAFSHSMAVSEHEQPSTFVRIKESSTKIGSNFEQNIKESLSKPNRIPLYRHKMVKTEGQTYFNNLNNFNNINFKDDRNFQTYLSEMPPTERPPEQLYSNKISSQYSIHILNAFATEKKLNKNHQKVKFKQFEGKGKNFDKKSSHFDAKSRPSSSSGYDYDHRKRVSIQQMGSQITQKHSRMYSRSVLDELARSIEVQEEPTSRQCIN